jgi:FdhE protein
MALFPEGYRWDRGACWVCGAPALLAELLGPAQARHLRCGRCGASWGYPRLACVHCGNEDPSTRGVLLPEGGAGTPRIETCDACRGYIKAVASHDPAPADLLSVVDLETLSLDFLARARGYRRYPR